jgi:sec-independent protein translocase protein TatA
MFGKAEELLIVLLIILLLFGSKKIPELARSIGQSVREVRKGFSGEEEEEKTPAANPASKSKTKTGK